MNDEKSTPLGFGVACDWLTLATYKFKAYTDFAAYLRSEYPKGWKKARWLQYDGFGNKFGVFYGHAIQSNEREHFVVKITGGAAAEFLPEILEQDFAEQFYATRIDFQRTIPKPEWWEPREVKDFLDGENVVCSMIESETGSTVYIGARASGRFTRMYEKHYERLYVRLEIELKSQHARIAWGHLLQKKNPRDIYAAHLEKLPLDERAMRDYAPDDVNDLDLRKHRRIIDSKRQLDWLKTLIPKFQQMANSHEIGGEVRDVFYSLSIDKGDDDNESGN